MNNLKNVKSVEDLLEEIGSKPHPILIKIYPAHNPSNFLMEEVITRIISEYKSHIEYIKIDHADTHQIMEDLKLTKSPIFLLVVQGEIIEVLSGTVGYQQLHRTIGNVIDNNNINNTSLAI